MMTKHYTPQQKIAIAIGAVRHAMREENRNPEDWGATAALDMLVDLCKGEPHLIAAEALDLMRHDDGLRELFRSSWERWADEDRNAETKRRLRLDLDRLDRAAITVPEFPAYIVCRHDGPGTGYNALPYLGAGFVPLPPSHQVWPGLLLIVGPRDGAEWMTQRLASGMLLRGPDNTPAVECYSASYPEMLDLLHRYATWWAPRQEEAR
jgi:hypothetical protein